MTTNTATTFDQGRSHGQLGIIAGLAAAIVLAAAALAAAGLGSGGGSAPAAMTDAQKVQAMQEHRAGERQYGPAPFDPDKTLMEHRRGERLGR